MTYVKIVNNTLEYFQQPAHIIGDASQYAIENGYKPLKYNDQIPDVNEFQKIQVEWIEENGYITEKYNIIDKTLDEIEIERIEKIPAEISKRQLNLALFSQYGIENESILQMIEQIPDEMQKKIVMIEYRDGAYVSRSHPFVNDFAEKLGISQRNLDDLFTYAKTL